MLALFILYLHYSLHVLIRRKEASRSGCSTNGDMIIVCICSTNMDIMITKCYDPFIQLIIMHSMRSKIGRSQLTLVHNMSNNHFSASYSMCDTFYHTSQYTWCITTANCQAHQNCHYYIQCKVESIHQTKYSGRGLSLQCINIRPYD